MRNLGVDATDKGRADASFNAAQTNATNKLGPNVVGDTEMFNRSKDAWNAKVVTEQYGSDPGEAGRRTGSRQGAIEAANLWRDQAVSQALGLNPEDIRDNVKYQQMSNSQVQLGLTPEMARRVANNPNVDLSPEQRRFMQENPNAGYAMNFHMNQDGTWAAGSVKAGVNISSGNFTEFRDGFGYNSLETAGGGNKLLEAGHVETLMGRAFNLDGSVNQSSLAMFGKAYGEALRDNGFTLTSQHANELRDHTNTSAFGSVSGGVGGGIGFASGRMELGIRRSLDESSGSSNTDSVHADKNLLLVQHLGAGAMEQARNEYRNQHGTLPDLASDPGAATQIYSRASDLFREDFNSLVNSSKESAYKIPNESDGSGTDESGTNESGKSGKRSSNDWAWKSPSSL